ERAVAAAEAACAAGTSADRMLLHDDRVSELDDLRIGHARVRHVRLDGCSAVEAVTRAGTAGDGLVVLVAIVAEGEVVHGALRGRHDAECAIERIGDALGRLYVAGDRRRGRRGRQHRTGWN